VEKARRSLGRLQFAGPGSAIRKDNNENHIFKIRRDFRGTLEACDEVTHTAGLGRIDNRCKSAQR
jgi:hypothetical protein